MKLLRSSVFALMLGAAFPACLIAPADAQVSIDVSVEIAPPPLPYYEQPIIPAEGYIWVPGYWAWDPNEGDYYWVPGTWVEPPQPELLWTPAYWGWVGGRYVFHPGYWGREVGFYGGIDYGFGYTGDGYYGGHWEHGAFFYNRAVNNITNVRITNVYNQTVVVNNTVNRVGFNGGNGGTTARPTPQQEAFARQQHVEATPAQRQHVEAASKDRALFAKQNHGEPAVAATARPGVMQGEGVTRASRTPAAPAAPPNREPGRTEQLPRPGQEPPRATETGREGGGKSTHGGTATSTAGSTEGRAEGRGTSTGAAAGSRTASRCARTATAHGAGASSARTASARARGREEIALLSGSESPH